MPGAHKIGAVISSARIAGRKNYGHQAFSDLRTLLRRCAVARPPWLGNGPKTVSESTGSNTKLSEFFGPRRVPGREPSEFLSAFCLCAKANSQIFSQNSPSLAQSSVSSLFQNSTITQNYCRIELYCFEFFSVVPAL